MPPCRNLRRRRATDDRRVLRFGGAAIAVAVWALLIFSPRQGGLTADYVFRFTVLLGALAAVDLTAPRPDAPLWRRLLWLAVELALAYLVLREQHAFVRPQFAYLVPAMRALLMFGGWAGPALSLAVWLPLSVNIWDFVWRDRLRVSPDFAAILRDGFTDQQAALLKDEFRNYLLFFLAPYTVTVLLTFTMTRQAEHRRRVQALYDGLRAAHDELKALHARVRETAVTEERNRLAREIHDSLAHYLTVINVQLEAAEKLHPADASLAQVQRARRLTLDCLQEVRRSVAALRASSLDELSLPRALRKLATAFSENTGIPVALDLRLPQEERLAPETSLALYRVAQEGLTNVHRHARATVARLSLTRDNGHIEIAVEDDGVGPPAESNGDGFGLLGLRERVALLGGNLSLETAPTGGARLAVTVPVARDQWPVAKG